VDHDRHERSRGPRRSRERPLVPRSGASVGKLDASRRIAENRDYYNLAEMFAQLGIQPAAPSQLS
jgi:hypothetical protein